MTGCLDVDLKASLGTPPFRSATFSLGLRPGPCSGSPGWEAVGSVGLAERRTRTRQAGFSGKGIALALGRAGPGRARRGGEDHRGWSAADQATGESPCPMIHRQPRANEKGGAGEAKPPLRPEAWLLTLSQAREPQSSISPQALALRVTFLRTSAQDPGTLNMDSGRAASIF